MVKHQVQVSVRDDLGLLIPPIGHVLSPDAEIGRSIDESYAPQLQCLLNYLASTQSNMAFKRTICDLKRRECGDNHVLKSARSDAEHLQIVKRLRKHSAADSLFTMYNTVKPFQDDTGDLVHHLGDFFDPDTNRF